MDTRNGGTKIDFSVHRRGRSVDPAQRVIEFPLCFARRGVERVELRVATASIDHAVHDRGRGLEADLIVNERILAGMKAPLLFSVPNINRVEITVPAPDKGDATHDRGTCIHHIAGPEFPTQLTRVGVQRIQTSIAAAEINCTVYHGGTG